MERKPVAELARRFWDDAGGAGDPPYDIELACMRALPLVTTLIPGLTARAASLHLQRLGTSLPLSLNGRRLHGCVVACRGKGFLFLDAVDPEDQRRFTIAHEVGHFILDYQIPRQSIMERLGPTSVEVLDGVRPPTFEERASALLAGAPLSLYVRFQDRGSEGCATPGRGAEGPADELAVELLAPRATVCEAVGPLRGGGFDSLRSRLEAVLRDRFGLPAGIARRHAERLAHAWTGGRTFREWLGGD